VGGAIYIAHTSDQFKKLGINLQRSETLGKKLHAHSFQYAHKLTSTRRAIRECDVDDEFDTSDSRVKRERSLPTTGTNRGRKEYDSW